LADRTPICVGTIWLAAERFPDAGRIYERMRSMTKLLAHYGVRDYRRASTRVTAAIVDATDAARLDLRWGARCWWSTAPTSTPKDAAGDQAHPLCRKKGSSSSLKQLERDDFSSNRHPALSFCI